MNSHFLREVAEQLGVPQGQAKPMSAEEREALYSASFALYETGKYEESSDFFTRLTLSDPFEERYWRGLASSRQMEQKYRESLHAWCMVALLKEKDPLPHFHAAECLLSLGEKEEAHKALCAAEKNLSENDSSRTLRSKIELLKGIHKS